MKHRKIVFIAASLCALVLLAGHEALAEPRGPLAKSVADKDPWLHILANSEERQPVYIGATPRELALRLAPADGGADLLYETLRERGEREARQVRDALTRSGALKKDRAIELEAWPARDDYGQLTWVFARWRLGPARKWLWLDAAMLPASPDPYMKGQPMLPILLDPVNANDYSRIFDDVLSLKSLYDKPLFGECVWTKWDGSVMRAWLPVSRMAGYGKKIAYLIKGGKRTSPCRAIAPPARRNGDPITYIVKVEGNNVVWPKGLRWKKEDSAFSGPASSAPRITAWPGDFVAPYIEDVGIVAGEKEAIFPVSKKKATFTRKNAADNDNQLQDLIAYLEERYKALGIETFRQDFTWRGMPQSNLVAIIPGSDPLARPVLMLDHIDTAFCDDTFERTSNGERVSSPGADDNASGTAVLLRAAGILKGSRPLSSIWLVHLTGAEFPADGLGARFFVSRLLKSKMDAEGAVLVDMIGRREKGDAVFQIHAGDAPGSLGMAKIASDAAKALTDLEPVVRARFDDKSYLYNTDGIIFSDSGFPVIVLGENINRPEDRYRKGRHYTTDTSEKMDWKYATDIAKVAIETAAALAEANPPAPRAAVLQDPEWSVIVYGGSDAPGLTKEHRSALRALIDAPVPDNVELLAWRDTDTPDSSARIIRRADAHREMMIRKKDASGPDAFSSFLKWAAAHTKGKHTLLVVPEFSSGMIPPDRIAEAVSGSAFRPDIALISAAKGNAEAVEELKGVAPYLIVSSIGTLSDGSLADRLYATLGVSALTPYECARVFPKSYVEGCSCNLPAAGSGDEYGPVGLASIDTAKWNAFTAKFKHLVEALKKTDFRAKVKSEKAWLESFADSDNNADIVEFLERLPSLVDDVTARKIAHDILHMIGYPEKISEESAATMMLDPSKARSFELRIETCPYLAQDQARGRIEAAWKEANQGLSLPEGLVYDVVDSGSGAGLKREFVVKGQVKEPLRFRPWLPGTTYCILKIVDTQGYSAVQAHTKEQSYFFVDRFPKESFMAGEAHSQGAPFIHGIGLAFEPGTKAGSAWNKLTGWGELIAGEAAPVKADEIQQP